jgi:hypothetical protein
VAENLIISITLDTDLGAGFGIGTKISTYWDDVSNVFVVKKIVPTPVLGANIATEGDAGSFEALASTWGSIGPYLTRSSVQAYAGTYSGLYTQPNTTNNLIASQYLYLQYGVTYKVSCYVYIPSVNKFGSSTTSIRMTSTSPYTPISNEISIFSIGLFTNIWQEVSFETTVTGGSDFYQFDLLASKGIRTINGICYIDQFRVEAIGISTETESTITTGPDLGDVKQTQVENAVGFGGFGGSSFSYTSRYGFCGTGFFSPTTTHTEFRTTNSNPSFPYSKKYETANSFKCTSIPIGDGTIEVPPTCDIRFDGDPVIVKATNQYSADGSFTVVAISKNILVRYSLDPDQSYQGMTNLSGSFTGLSIGEYTCYARDQYNCKTSITVKIYYEDGIILQPTDPIPTYGVIYRMEHDNIYGVEERIDILERNFAGDFTEIKGGDKPFTRKLGNTSISNKFESIRPTFATIQLASERDLQYIGLFSQDDRKYQVKYYNPVGTLVWTGYLVPSLFSEPYTTSSPYITQFDATDNLVQLDEISFLDESGNKFKGKISLIVLISLILKRLSLDLNINVGMNITEDTQNDNVPLEETYVEASSYYEDDGTPWACSRVIKSILEPFGAKIVQENGFWNIIRIEEQTASYSTRLYDSAGVFISSSTYDPIVEIIDPSLRLSSAFRDSNHVLEVVPAYGTVTINRTLFPKNNLLFNGEFDPDNYDPITNSIYGWTVVAPYYSVRKVIGSSNDRFTLDQSIQLGNRIRPTITTYTTSFNRQLNERRLQRINEYALEIRGLVDNQTFSATAQTFAVELTSSDFFIFSFDYRINGATVAASRGRMPDFIRMRYSLQLGSYFYNEVIGWGVDEEFRWNYIYVDKYNTTLKHEVQARVKGAETVSIRPLVVVIEGQGSNYSDFTFVNSGSVGDLNDITTTDKVIGYRVRGAPSVNIDGLPVVQADYELRYGTDATSSPDILRPDDYNGTTNKKVWALVSYQREESFNDVDQFYIDNVTFEFLPNGDKATDKETVEIENNLNYKENLIVELEGGDVTDQNINNKKNIYKGIFLDPNYEPTTTWLRTVGGKETLQNLLLSSIMNQYRFPTFKVSGNIIGFERLGFLTTFKQTIDQPTLSLTNPDFTSNITGWTNTGTGTAWAYGSSSARVTLSGATDSQLLRQSVNFESGQRVRIDYNIQRQSTTGTRNDWLQIYLQDSSGSNIQIVTIAELISDNTIARFVRFNVSKDAVYIGFKIIQVEGTGSSQYDVNSFNLNGQTVVKYFTPNSMEIDSSNNSVSSELIQLIPIVPVSDGDIDDSGENNTNTEGGAGGGISGSGSYTGGDYNNDYNSDYKI